MYEFSPTTFHTALMWCLAAAAAWWYLTRLRRAPAQNVVVLRRLMVVSVTFFLALALFLSVAQYLTWAADPFSVKLLPPHQPISYFLKYAGTHFWLGLFFSLIVALAFFLFLRALARRNERFFEEGEVELGALLAFIAGWPRIVVFFPAVFLAVVLMSGAKMALRKGAYTTLGVPFFAGLFAALVAGSFVLDALGLRTLTIIPGTP